MIALALYQPDIPQNAGTLLRLGACLGVPVHVIEPAGFDLSDRALRRSGLDYLTHADLVRHLDWATFTSWIAADGRRLVLATTRAGLAHVEARFAPGDVLLLGRESAGVPDAVHAAAALAVTIPMRPGMRSLNVAVAGAMILGEALRQTGGFPAA
ncbi:tRNA (cytidine(34)-2'-O)-methyltransferase [Methylobrevis albus]|uniref:tRNA (cytidine(34)-2'-O)-methyltransferase n=1 Tax=Methylobrevis albus TaxID=2793297 RepID=A0A931I0E5_9HYPH|nr:tRNA (cytidine(34)-2'-O)-methyltransferase [Methylobrevis albus]MBH0236668.1 tRNA (cytidine(34)-2'-O)-methyltransferase [Methylobrevis albus]